MDDGSKSRFVKETAYQLGFDFVGISEAKFLQNDAIRLEKWLKQGHHGKMSYMENYFDKRVDPRKLVKGAKSVVSLMYNYHTKRTQDDKTAPKLSKYALGDDYHYVIKAKLNHFEKAIKQTFGDIHLRYFVDSAPVLDRAWARESGLGWIGKNSMLINKEKGSEFFLAEIILDVKMAYDGPIKDYCGTCTACIDACPTDAIEEERTVNAEKCISYLTIELKDSAIPEEFDDKMNNWAFGCDICQEVCPWNRFSTEHNEKAFNPSERLLAMTKSDWETLEKEDFNQLFKNSAVKRTKFAGLKRNIQFLKKLTQKPQE